MPSFTSPVDGTTLFYRYYDPDPAIVEVESAKTQPVTLIFLHGWPMSSRMFDQLLVPLCETHRYRCIAPDRRGFGKSDWNTSKTGPITFDLLVSDLVALLEFLNPGPFVFVGASMGCSESLLAHENEFVRTHCKGFAWIGPNMPYSTRCDESPGSPPLEIWEFLRAGFRGPTAKQFIAEQVPGIFRTDMNPLDARVLQFFERLAVQADPLALERMITVMRRPMHEELTRFVDACGETGKKPVLILHGDSDAGMPVEVSAARVKEIVPWADLKVYENAGHGLYLTHTQDVLGHLAAFCRGVVSDMK